MSIIKQENTDKNTVEFEIAVNAEEFEAACTAVYFKKKNSITVHGFRKGKATRQMIEKIYGESVFFEDAINDTYNKALQEAVDEAKLELVARPKVEIIDVSKDKGYTFKAVCITKPEVEISDYKGIKAEKTVKTPTDEEVQESIDRKREQTGRLVVAEDRPAENGDTVTFDFEGFVDDIAFEGGKGEDYTLKLGSGQFIPGFEEQIEGKSIGEEFDVNVTFPEEYHAEELKGKAAVFKCKLHEIKYTELPELDDEFAKDVSEFNTLDELKADIKSSLEKQYNKQAEDDFNRQIDEAVIALLKGDIPDVMYDSAAENMVQEFEQRLKQQGLNLETYLSYIGKTPEELKEQYLEQAQMQVKADLAYEKIAELENFEITDEDIDAECNELAEQYKIEADKIKDMLPKEDMIKGIAKSKAGKLVRETAEVTEKDN